MRRRRRRRMPPVVSRKRPRPPTGLGHTVVRGSLILLVTSEVVIPDFDSIRRRPTARPTSADNTVSRQQRRLRFGALGAEAEELVPAIMEPFVDDGMFDPRVDYWSKLGRSGLPEGSNLTAGACAYLGVRAVTVVTVIVAVVNSKTLASVSGVSVARRHNSSPAVHLFAAGSGDI